MNASKKRDFYIGLSVIVALLILIFGIDYLKGVNLFTPSNFYVAEYENVSDLTISSPVLINGYKVGQVRDIEFDYEKPGKLKVILALNKKLSLPEGSVAKIGTTLMSGAYIDLHLGNSSKMLPVGSTLASERTPDLMSALQSDLMPDVSSMLHRVDSLLISLNTIVSDPALRATVSRLDGISSNIDGISSSLLLTSKGLGTTINSDLPIVMKNVKGISANVNTISGDLTALSNQLHNLQLQPTMQNLEQVSTNLNKFSAQLNDPNSTLGQLTTNPELYNRVSSLAAGVDSLIYDIKKNPKRYINIKIF